ncbi:MAG: hypothetical protein WCY63_03685 [Weeksellaceae bacterium]
MKTFNYILIIVLLVSNFECRSTHILGENSFTSIKSEVLKNKIVESIPLLKRDERWPMNISIRVLTSKNNIYLNVLAMDCDEGEYYKFYEGFNGEFIPVYIDQNSYKPERFFDLKNLSVTSNKFEDTGFYCDDYFFVQSRISVLEDDFTIEKTITSENFNPKEIIYTKEDTELLKGIIKVEIPEPKKKLKNID